MANKIQFPSAEEMRADFLAIFGGENARFLPKARGWRMLVMMPAVKTTTSGGVHLPDQYVQQEVVASPVGLVVDMGELCFSDPRKFPGSKPWCNIDDVIAFRSYSGTRLIIKEREFRFISDESVDGVVPDPRGIERV